MTNSPQGGYYVTDYLNAILNYESFGGGYYENVINQLMSLGYVTGGWNYTAGEHHIYGSSRIGVHQTNTLMRTRYASGDISITLEDSEFTQMYRGKRHYELSNHLGNVQVVVSDKRVSICDEYLGVERFESEVLSAMDYYPFGMMMPERQWYANSDSSIAVNGFNGYRKDNEISGVGNSIDFGARIYDSRLGRFLSVDPLSQSFSHYSPFQFAFNSPITSIDINGMSGDDDKNVEHTVQAGETLSELAKKYGTTVAEIKKLNTQIDWNDSKRTGKRQDWVYVGDNLLIPYASSTGGNDPDQLRFPTEKDWEKIENKQASFDEVKKTIMVVEKIGPSSDGVMKATMFLAVSPRSIYTKPAAPTIALGGMILAGGVFIYTQYNQDYKIHFITVPVGLLNQYYSLAGETAIELVPQSLQRSKSWHGDYAGNTEDELEEMANAGDQMAKDMLKLVRESKRILDKIKNSQGPGKGGRGGKK